MSDLERDEVVAQALRDLPVPAHRDGFWDDLEAHLRSAPTSGERPAGTLTERLAAAGTAPAGPDRPDAADGRLGTGELPAVAALDERRRPSRAPFLVAAAVLVLLGAVGFVTLAGGGDDDEAELADRSDTTATLEAGAGTFEAPATDPPDTTAPQGGDPITTSTAPSGNDDSPEGVVVSWIDALGTGDAATAATLVGPRSTAYIESLQGSVEGFMTESFEGYGAWAGAEDRTVALLPGGPIAFDGGQLQVVVLTGTHAGEGEAEARVQVLPVVDDGQGFKVEHLAFDPARDNDPEFTLPAETERGLGTFAPDDEINVFVPADGIVYFQVDGGEVGTDQTSEVAGDPFALYDPPGDLTPGQHSLVLVAVGDDGTIAHFGGTFTVEG